ncbi:unnamed protein product [Spirodela intermedia]|uniref:Uncharacterized protein n=1 Tax=Spirodela intermedia TaxID=51605 RepID=A0A7I8IKL4_SPIIN|nr:unnamed protein product [Spirodela intermedia]CAA6658283.1 unnamed protein product [Spirodela intermedia]
MAVALRRAGEEQIRRRPFLFGDHLAATAVPPFNGGGVPYSSDPRPPGALRGRPGEGGGKGSVPLRVPGRSPLPCIAILTILALVTIVVVSVKLQLYCRGPFHSVSHLLFKSKCES